MEKINSIISNLTAKLQRQREAALITEAHIEALGKIRHDENQLELPKKK